MKAAEGSRGTQKDVMHMRCLLVMLLSAVVSAAAFFPLSSAETQVYVRPTFMDAAAFTPVSGTIHIAADRPGTYSVSITGIPADWMEYPRTVRAEAGREKVVTYVVSPREAGSYTIFISVKGPGGSFDFENGLWVGPSGAAGPGSASGQAGGAGSGGPGGTGLTGMFAFNAQDVALALYCMAGLAVAIAVVLGYMVLRKEEAPAGGIAGRA